MRTKFKTIHKVLAASVLMMLGLAACTSDSVVSTNNGQQKGEARQVKFSINTGVKSTTRATAATAADVTALERENTVNKLYAVVFKPSAANTLKPGDFSKTYEVTLTGAGTDNQTYSSATFKMDDDGLYYMYLVANPGTELEKNLTNDTGASAPLVAGTSTVNDFFALMETDRNPNDNSATNFLMTSNVVQVDIQGDGATDLTNGGSRYIELKRAAARIDIDATAIDGFELISVQFVNRHPASVMVNTGTDNALTGENSTSTTNPTYTKPAVDDTYSFTDKWLAGIYGYENHKEAAAGDETGITQLIINGKLNGIAVSQTVDFYSKEETSPGSGTYTYTTIPLNRNTLYYVKLKPKATPDEYAPLAYTIQVANWRTGETIVFAGENLAKACKPELISIKQQLWDETNGVWADATDLTLTTVSLNVVDNGTPRTVTDGKNAMIKYETVRLAIKVKAGTTGCNIECPELDETLSGAASTYHTGVIGADKKGLFEGEQSNPLKTYDDNGDMYQTWYVQISAKTNDVQKYNFTLTNQLNSENDYITHFQVINSYYDGIQVGDLIYQDGSWSTASNRNSIENAGKTPVAIVFATVDDANNPITMPNYDKARGYFKGYAMALKESSSVGTQFSTTALTSYVTDAHVPASGVIVDGMNADEIFDDMSGLEHCAKIQEKIDAGTYNINSFPAYKSAVQYVSVAGETLAEKTSRWYLPSIGQTFYWYLATGKTDLTRTNWKLFSAGPANLSWHHIQATQWCTFVNTWLSQKLVTEAGLSAGDYTPFAQWNGYWSSSERTINYVWWWGCHTGAGNSLEASYPATNTYGSSSSYIVKVRPIIAF